MREMTKDAFCIRKLDVVSGKVVTDITSDCARAVALGFYETLHKGHLQIIAGTVDYAHKNSLKAAVLTFVNFPKEGSRDVLTLHERAEILASMGVDEFFVINFSSEMKSLDYLDFYNDIIVRIFNAKALFAGNDYSFGAGGTGDITKLSKLCSESSVKLQVFDDICVDGKRVSSSFIRELLDRGDVETVSKLTDYAFSYKGIVKEGKKLGRTLGFPTINIDIEKDKYVVLKGVYASKAVIFGKEYNAITNVGLRPTAEKAEEVRTETHIFDFNEDLYGKEAEIIPVKFIREEIKFNSIEELKRQIESDCSEALKFFRNE